MTAHPLPTLTESEPRILQHMVNTLLIIMAVNSISLLPETQAGTQPPAALQLGTMGEPHSQDSHPTDPHPHQGSFSPSQDMTTPAAWGPG